MSVTAVGVATFAAVIRYAAPNDAPDHQGVCVDSSTQQRVDDGRCDSGATGGSGARFVPHLVVT